MLPGKAGQLVSRNEYRSRTGPTLNTADLGVVQAPAINAGHPQSGCTRDITSDSYLLRQSLRNANTNAAHHVGYCLSVCLLYTSPSPRDGLLSRMPSSACTKK